MADFTELDRRASAQFGLLSAEQLLEAGYSKRMVAQRVSRGEFRRRGRGVVQLAGTRESWEQDLLAAVLSVSRDGLASHRSAARLWGFRSVDPDIELSIRYPRKASAAGAIVHSIRDLELSDRTEISGIPVTTPERTICDLGLIFPETEVHRILLHAIATGLVLPRDLWSMRQRTSKQGRNGTGVLERVLAYLPSQTAFAESGLELLFAELCERFNIESPVAQLPVRVFGRDFRLDFAWVTDRVFVEIDGAAFHSSPAQIANDGGRQNLLVQAGWTPLRFTYADLTERPGFCARLINSTRGSVPTLEPMRYQTGDKS